MKNAIFALAALLAAFTFDPWALAINEVQPIEFNYFDPNIALTASSFFLTPQNKINIRNVSHASYFAKDASNLSRVINQTESWLKRHASPLLKGETTSLFHCVRVPYGAVIFRGDIKKGGHAFLLYNVRDANTFATERVLIDDEKIVSEANKRLAENDVFGAGLELTKLYRGGDIPLKTYHEEEPEATLIRTFAAWAFSPTLKKFDRRLLAESGASMYLHAVLEKPRAQNSPLGAFIKAIQAKQRSARAGLVQADAYLLAFFSRDDATKASGMGRYLNVLKRRDASVSSSDIYAFWWQDGNASGMTLFRQDGNFIVEYRVNRHGDLVFTTKGTHFVDGLEPK